MSVVVIHAIQMPHATIHMLDITATVIKVSRLETFCKSSNCSYFNDKTAAEMKRVKQQQHHHQQQEQQ